MNTTDKAWALFQEWQRLDAEADAFHLEHCAPREKAAERARVKYRSAYKKLLPQAKTEILERHHRSQS